MWYKGVVRRWGLVALVLVVLLGGFATAARSSDRAARKTFYIESRFRVDFAGTSTVNWTMTPGSTCDAQGGGSQQIQVTSAGPARLHTIKLALDVYRGTVANITVWLPVQKTYFRVAQTDDRQGSLDAPNCSDASLGSPVGGAGSLCGKTTNHYLQGLAFRPNLNVAKDRYVVKHCALQLGLWVNPVGQQNGVGNPYYGDPNGVLSDCPSPGDGMYSNYFVDGTSGGIDLTNTFLLFAHDTANDLGETLPSYAGFSLAKLESCGAKTITGQTTAHDATSGPFAWGTDGTPPPDTWAFWHATTTLHWKMTLHRLRGCKRIAGQ